MSVKSFFEKIGSDFESLFKHAPTWQQSANGIITVVAPLALTIISLVDPVLEPEASAIIQRIQAGLAVIKTVASDATAAVGSTAVQSVQTAITGINSDMSQLLSTMQVKDPATVAKVTAAANTITTEMSMLLNALPVRPLLRPLSQCGTSRQRV